MSVRMADAPIEADHVNVTFTKVEASGPGGWRTLMEDPDGVTVDLKTLVFTDMELAKASLPAGHYNQVRLGISKVEIVRGTETFAVTVPSGFQTGIKLNVNADVPPNAVTEVLLDFNVARSIHATPPGSTNYVLKPVIPAVVKVLSGTVSGTVTFDGTPAKGAVVEVYQGTTLVNSSTAGDDGTFKVWALLAGTYDVKFTFTHPTTNAPVTTTVTGVTVTATQDTTLNAALVSATAPAPVAE